jgi:hypothetical protein
MMHICCWSHAQDEIRTRSLRTTNGACADSLDAAVGAVLLRSAGYGLGEGVLDGVEIYCVSGQFLEAG